MMMIIINLCVMMMMIMMISETQLIFTQNLVVYDSMPVYLCVIMCRCF